MSLENDILAKGNPLCKLIVQFSLPFHFDEFFKAVVSATCKKFDHLVRSEDQDFDHYFNICPEAFSLNLKENFPDRDQGFTATAGVLGNPSYGIATRVSRWVYTVPIPKDLREYIFDGLLHMLRGHLLASWLDCRHLHGKSCIQAQRF